MKLIKLLTVGRSFKGGKPVSGTYKLQQILLPKFSSSVRPSKAAAAKAAALLPAATIPVATHVEKFEIAPAPEPPSHGMDKTQKIPAGKILKRKPEPTMISIKSKIAGWSQKKVSAIKKRLFPVRSKKKSGDLPTQAEWNLEKITVVRNDLSEADLEIVKPKAAGATGQRKTHFPDLDCVKNSGRAWVKATKRLFKTSSPFVAGAAESPKQVVAQDEAAQRELAERI